MKYVIHCWCVPPDIFWLLRFCTNFAISRLAVCPYNTAQIDIMYIVLKKEFYNLKNLILILSALLCCSCATVKTLSPENSHVVIQHQGKKSYCEEIPRIYSGVSYNLCLLYGEPNRNGDLGGGLNGVPWFIFDSVFSAVADTVVIPYTLVAQTTKGNIKVN